MPSFLVPSFVLYVWQSIAAHASFPIRWRSGWRRVLLAVHACLNDGLWCWLCRVSSSWGQPVNLVSPIRPWTILSAYPWPAGQRTGVFPWVPLPLWSERGSWVFSYRNDGPSLCVSYLSSKLSIIIFCFPVTPRLVHNGKKCSWFGQQVLTLERVHFACRGLWAGRLTMDLSL